MTLEEKMKLLEQEEALLKKEEILAKEKQIEMELIKQQAQKAHLERERIINHKKIAKRRKWIIGLTIFLGLAIIGHFMPDDNSAANPSYETNKAKLEHELSEMQKQIQKNINQMNLQDVSIEEKNGNLTLSMQNILFKAGSADLNTNLKVNLARIAGILLVNKDVNIEVQGHTDNTGDFQMNQKLSELRAMNVVSFLVEQGIERNRLTYKGFGNTKPIADNSTIEGKKKNRRVDLVIVDK